MPSAKRRLETNAVKGRSRNHHCLHISFEARAEHEVIRRSGREGKGGQVSIWCKQRVLTPFSDQPSWYLFLSERQRKSRAEAAVRIVTTPRMMASRLQGAPTARRSATRISSVLAHSNAPKTRKTCTSRATHRRLNSSSPGRVRLTTTSGSIPALRKCAAKSKQLKTTGSSLKAFI